MKDSGKGTVVLEEKRPPLVARMLGIAVVLVMGGVLVVWGVDLGKRIMGASHGAGVPDLQRQLDDAQAEIARLTAERDALQAALKAAGVPAVPAAPVEGASAAAASLAGGVAAVAPAPAASAAGTMPAAATPAATAPAAGTAASGKITALPLK